MRLLLLFFLSGLCFARRPEQIIGYIFPKDAVINPADVAVEKLTRINYAFANLSGGKVVPGFAHDPENFQVLNGLKQRNPSLKILISVGGWTWSGAFSDAALSKESRKVFIDSAVEFVSKYNLDGLDIDWEYPGLPGNGNKFRPEDKENFTALLKELRQAFNKAGRTLGRRLLTSVATGANPDFAAHTELAKVARAVDTINLMCYDYYEPTDDKIAGHHAPLFTNPNDPKHVSADASVNLYRAAGVPAKKLVLGVPFYGHAWVTAGLYQTAESAREPQDLTGFQRNWDAVSAAPYLYNASTRTFLSLDDPESLKRKCEYVRHHKLAGIMFWDYESDRDHSLLNAVFSGLNE